MHSSPGGAAAPGDQPAVIMLRFQGEDEPTSCYCRVTKITPGGLRLETPAVNVHAFEGLFSLNREVELFLPLPRPHPPVETRARLVGLQLNYSTDSIPVAMDLEFLAISPEEEEALRDSNPGLLRLRAG